MESEKVKNKIRDQRRGHAHNKDKVRSHSSLLPSLPDRTGRRVRISLRNAALPVRNQERGDQSRPPCIFYINHGKAGSSHPLTPVRTLPPCLPQVHMVLRPEQSSLGAPSQAWGEPSSPRFRHFHGQCPSCQVSALFFPEELTEQQKPDSVTRKDGGAGLPGVTRSDWSHFLVSPPPPTLPSLALCFALAATAAPPLEELQRSPVVAAQAPAQHRALV